ncbi:hypothetical protein Tco_1135040 [Tanacetum coccineum]
MAQRIWLYYKGKDHGEYILQFINEGSFKMGQCRDEIATGTDGPYLGPEQDKVVVDLLQAEKDRLIADISATNILLQGRQNKVQGNNARGVVAAENRGAQNRAGNANAGQGKPIKCYNCNWIDEEQLLFLAGRQTNTFDDDVDKGPVQDMAQNKDNIFQADQCDASDSDVDEAPTAQTLFMANLSSADLVYDEAGPSYDFDTLSEVQDHDNCLDNMNESPEEHEMHNDDNEDQFVHNDVSYVPNDAIMIITNDIYEQDAQCVTSNKPNNTVNASLIAELARYKELSKSFYDEVNRVAIGYKNPFYLSKAKQVQRALYNGHEIVKTNHARALVHDSKDTLEIAETTRKQMIEKMKDPECVKKKVKISPHDYSKENYQATFTPQKQLTPEQIFWSDDLLKMKAKALKEKAKFAKPITSMMVYRKTNHNYDSVSSQYTCKAAPINEIKEMKEVFDQMEAEVDQNAIDKKCDEIERKNLLIENENLSAECLSKYVFYTATGSVLTVSRFSNMHDAYTATQKCITKLEAGNFNLTQKIQTVDMIELSC